MTELEVESFIKNRLFTTHPQSPKEITTFEEEHGWKGSRGLILSFSNGEEFRMTIVKSRESYGETFRKETQPND